MIEEERGLSDYGRLDVVQLSGQVAAVSEANGLDDSERQMQARMRTLCEGPLPSSKLYMNKKVLKDW